MAVKADGRLIGIERVPHCLASGSVVHGLPVLDNRRRRPHGGIQLQARIQTGVERGTVEVEDAPRRVGHIGHEFLDELADLLVHPVLMPFVPSILIGVALEPIEPKRVQTLLELGELFRRCENVLLLVEPGPPDAAGVAHDRDEQLAHQVATEDERVDVVELRGIQELSVGGLRAVDVTRVEEASGFGLEVPLFTEQTHLYSPCIWGASSPTSRYHFFRSPTFARIFHPKLFGFVSIRASASSTCCATRSFSWSDSCGYAAAICLTLARFMVSVRHQPQSPAHTPATSPTLIVSPSRSPSGCSRSSMIVSMTSFSLICTICIFCISISASGMVSSSCSSRDADAE